ncbi:MAG: hypothetical protein HKN12_06150, partial [Gemmatimonadetes bacterium]|nr:hypothetical protein [Gemmatimonadota bacterium]
MSENPDGPIPASLELFQDFVSRFARGLENRVEGGVESTPVELVPVDRDALPEDLESGALVGRTVWT